MKSVLLKDLLDHTKDGEWGKGEAADGLTEMAVIRGTDFEKVRFGDISSVPTRFIPDRICKRKTLQPNDILIETAGGTVGNPTGKTVFLSERTIEAFGKPVTCASFSRFLRVKEGAINPHFLFWYLRNLWEQRLIFDYHIQHTGVARFQYTQFAGEQRIPLPDESTQHEIASVLGAVDDKIELNRRMSATLEEMARSLYRSWFIDFLPVHAKMEGRQPAFMDEATAALFPERFGDGGLPEGWINTQLESIFKSRNERDDGRNIQEFTSSNEGLFPRDQKYHKKLAASGSKNKIAYRGDFVFGLSRKVLNFGMLHQEIGAFSSAYRIYSVDAGYDFSCYIYEHMKFFPDYYYQAVSASSREGQSISDRNLLDLLVPVPPVSILSAFFEETEAFKKRIFSLESETNNLVGLRDSLLPKLMSGEIRVGEAREQVEEVA